MVDKLLFMIIRISYPGGLNGSPGAEGASSEEPVVEGSAGGSVQRAISNDGDI